MLSPRRLFLEIHDHDEAFRLLCSLAAAGGARRGAEYARVASLVADPALASKIARDGAERERQARIFTGLLRKRGLRESEPPEEMDHRAQLRRLGVGLAPGRLRCQEPLSDGDLVDHLVMGRVTGQRDAEGIHLMRGALAARPDMDRALRVVGHEETGRLADCHTELLRLTAADPELAARARNGLRRAARTESRVHRDASLALMARMGGILGWRDSKSALLRWGIHASYVYERCLGWRRMTRLRLPRTDRLRWSPTDRPTGRSTSGPARGHS